MITSIIIIIIVIIIIICTHQPQDIWAVALGPALAADRRQGSSGDMCIHIHICIYTHVCVYTYICIYTHICIYIYIYREREGERDIAIDIDMSLDSLLVCRLSVVVWFVSSRGVLGGVSIRIQLLGDRCVYSYIYIYTYSYIHVCIYVYIYV